MAERKRIRKIFNLLVPKQAPPTAWDTVYVWLATRARLVIILAQIGIAIVFFFKVVVDVQAKNLDDAIKEKDQLLAFTYAESEPKYRILQQQSLAYRNLWQGSNYYSTVIDEINKLFAPGSDLIVAFSDRAIDISGVSSRDQVAQLEAAIKSSANFQFGALYEIKSEGDEVTTGTRGFGLQAEITDSVKRPQ